MTFMLVGLSNQEVTSTARPIENTLYQNVGNKSDKISGAFHLIGIFRDSVVWGTLRNPF